MLAGIFVGGASRRMGGRAKGLLPGVDGRPLIVRTVELVASLGIDVALVGEQAAYGEVAGAARVLADLRGVSGDSLGPLGGLLALLEAAGEGHALALACDMPFLERSEIDRLLHAPAAAVVAARRASRWEPFFARYHAARVLPLARARAAAGELALQGLLDGAGAVELPLGTDAARSLDDWDTPDDVDGSCYRSRA